MCECHCENTVNMVFGSKRGFYDVDNSTGGEEADSAVSEVVR